MIENFLIHETVLVFLIEVLAHSHSLKYFQVLLVSARSDTLNMCLVIGQKSSYKKGECRFTLQTFRLKA